MTLSSASSTRNAPVRELVEQPVGDREREPLVFPVPPAPTTLTRCVSPSSSAINASTSSLRPTSGVGSLGRLVRSGSSVFGAGCGPGAEREQLARLGKVLQSMAAQRGELRPRRERRRRRRNQHLPTMCGRRHACGVVDVRAPVVAVADSGLTEVWTPIRTRSGSP